uniref:TSA: Wollemia nobilis Ref_Wollemi_Transcript_4191_1009 transcribed RNA sequence n=1 Tax=Wollemia nobilis TaxID=56998 RepID=A0A0C9QWH9_9CONI
MVKGYTQEHVYRHPWERVTAASWRKFGDPANRSTLSHILEVDTVDRTLDTTSGRLYSKRLITVNTPGPWWMQRLLGQNVCHCLETSVVDARNRSMELVTRNITLKDFVEVEEKSWFTPHPHNPQWTLSRQETSIRCATLSSALASIAEKVEQRCAEKFQQNSLKGREVMERICNYLEADTI